MNRRARVLIRVALGCSTTVIALAVLAGCGSSTKTPRSTASTTGTPATTSTSTPTTSITTTSTATTTTTPVASTPEGAIRDLLAAGNRAYIGDCSTTSVPADIGKYCSILRKDNGATRSYLVGPVASEGDIYVVARKAQGWSVVQVTPTPALVP